MRVFSWAFLVLIFLPGYDFTVVPADPETDITTKIGKLLATRFANQPSFNRRFLYNPADLNGDGKMEFIVGLIGTEFCDNKGCRMLVLNSSFSVIGSIPGVNYPAFIVPVGAGNKGGDYVNLFYFSRANTFQQISWTGNIYQFSPLLSKSDSSTLSERTHMVLNIKDDPIYRF